MSYGIRWPYGEFTSWEDTKEGKIVAKYCTSCGELIVGSAPNACQCEKPDYRELDFEERWIEDENNEDAE